MQKVTGPDPRTSDEAEEVLGTRDVQITAFAHGQRIGVTADVARVEHAGGSAVVKVVSPGEGDAVWRGSHDPGSYRYWRREPLVYAAGLPAPYTDAGVTQPRLLRSYERPRGRVSLWLEDVRGTAGQDWEVERTRHHLRRLGRAQGTCAVSDAWQQSDLPWSDGVLREYLDNPEATSADIDWPLLHRTDLWESPLMARHFPADLRTAVLQLCDDRYAFVARGEKLPQTLCHHDAWPKNFCEDGDRTVVFDWAFPGRGWIGTDIGNYVSDTALDLLRPTEELPALDRAVFEGYCEGLRQGGWEGDTRLVRLGMCLMAAKWSWLVPVMLKRAAQSYDHTVYGSESVDADRLYGERAQVFRLLVAWAQEARELTADLFGENLSDPR